MIKEVKLLWMCEVEGKMNLMEVHFPGSLTGLPKLPGSPKAASGKIRRQNQAYFKNMKP